MAFAIAGLAISALGLLQSQQASRREQQALQTQGAYQAAVLRNNAAFAEIERQDALARGQFNAQQIQMSTAQLIGSQRAAFAANGVVVDEGTAGDVTAQTAYFGKLDEQMALHNASMEAASAEQDRLNLLADAQLAEMGADRLALASRQRATASLISGAGQIAQKWSSFNQPQTPTTTSNASAVFGTSSPDFL